MKKTLGSVTRALLKDHTELRLAAERHHAATQAAESILTVDGMIDYLKQFPGHLPLVVVYSLNDWPGDCWGTLPPKAVVGTPISMTTTGSDDPMAKQPALLFDIRDYV